MKPILKPSSAEPFEGVEEVAITDPQVIAAIKVLTDQTETDLANKISLALEDIENGAGVDRALRARCSFGQAQLELAFPALKAIFAKHQAMALLDAEKGVHKDKPEVHLKSQLPQEYGDKKTIRIEDLPTEKLKEMLEDDD